MRVVDIFETSGEAPSIAKDHPLLDADVAARVARYLTQGRPILISQELMPDCLAPARGECVPTGATTDGEWIWGDWVEYYVSEHRLSPGEEFVRYLRDRDYVPTEVSDERMKQAHAYYLD